MAATEEEAERSPSFSTDGNCRTSRLFPVLSPHELNYSSSATSLKDDTTKMNSLTGGKIAIRARIREWYERNITFKGLALVLIAAANIIPDVFGRVDFWSRHLGAIWTFLYIHSTSAITITCAALIWLDHRRVLAKRKSYDPRTLKGRVQQLRDEITAFLEGQGEKPAEVYNSSMTREEFTEANKDEFFWEEKLTYGFLLRFQDRLRRVYYEFGERGKAYLALAFALEEGQVKDEASVGQVIEMLGTMAHSIDPPKSKRAEIRSGAQG